MSNYSKAELKSRLAVLEGKYYILEGRYEALLTEAIEQTKQLVNKTRHDTAKEFLDEVSKHFCGAWLVELYKKYGVEVKEN